MLQCFADFRFSLFVTLECANVRRGRRGMNLIESLALIGASLVLLIFARGRHGESLSVFEKLPWVVGQFFAMAIVYLFIAGLMGVAANLHWLG
jgi:hypothetical protein